ncbi:hypothetical protein [Nocardia sp. NBC_01009]|uniref:hypothetical protein n=1 Tax=Nocardia sp. NBC_01009 TaxID=2975996 RepID=UPI003863AD3B|nr:hypothetical protein OHA42_25720 [Nocardia sp. NBC_01009]
MLSTDGDTPDELVRCGEVLSTVLLGCTLAGFATCPLTHLTEVLRSCAVIRGLIGRTQLPQAMVRVGTRPESAGNDPATPRRPLAEILDMPGINRAGALTGFGPTPGRISALVPIRSLQQAVCHGTPLHRRAPSAERRAPAR